MLSSLDKDSVLSLNKNWQRIGWRTPRQAIIAACPEYPGVYNVMLMDIEMDGDVLVRATPTNWDDWLNLPIRDCDEAVETKFRAIRLPRVMVASGFSAMPLKCPQLTANAIHQRDGLVDQYTGKKLQRHEATIDHVIPRSKGGKNSWDNLVTCEATLNRFKGNRSNEEVGISLLRKPRAPAQVPVSFLIRNPKHLHHEPFF